MSFVFHQIRKRGACGQGEVFGLLTAFPQKAKVTPKGMELLQVRKRGDRKAGGWGLGPTGRKGRRSRLRLHSAAGSSGSTCPHSGGDKVKPRLIPEPASLEAPAGQGLRL